MHYKKNTFGKVLLWLNGYKFTSKRYNGMCLTVLQHLVCQYPERKSSKRSLLAIFVFSSYLGSPLICLTSVFLVYYFPPPQKKIF